jgi:hypothetical protein
MIAQGEQSDGKWGIIMENGPTPIQDETGYPGTERQEWTQRSAGNPQALKPDLRWNLVTAWFDTDEAGVGDDLGMTVNGIRVFTQTPAFAYQTGYDPAYAARLFTSGQRFSLGGHGQPNPYANQIMDEFAICDFGDTGSAMPVKAAGYANDRYADGRYYKGDDARFVSDVLVPDAGRPARLLSARWTEYRPRDPRQELLVSWTASPRIPVTGTPRMIDNRLDGSRLELSLLPDTGNLASAPLQELTQAASIGRSLPGFRYRVRFVNAIANPNDNGVLETPFLDDITFLWQPAAGPRVLSWERP